MQLQDSLPPEPSTDSPSNHFAFEQSGSSFPRDQFKDTLGDSNHDSAFTLDPTAELSSEIKSLTPTADFNKDSATAGSGDPFAEFGSLKSVSGESVSSSDPGSQTAVKSLGPLSDLGSLSGAISVPACGSSLLTTDPFPDLSTAAFPAPSGGVPANSESSKPVTPGPDKPGETSTDVANAESSPFKDDTFANRTSGSSQLDTDWEVINPSPKPRTQSKTLSKPDKATKSDPSAAFGGVSDDSPFPSDPFAGSDAFGNDQTISNVSSTQSSNTFTSTTDTAVQPHDNKADPYAAFAELEVSKETTVPGSDFPAPPTDWFASVEKDALTSDSPVLSNLTDKSQPSGANVDFSIQTTAADPFSSLSSDLSGQTLTSAPVTTDLFSTISSLNDSEPPPLPKKQGPQRPAPPPSLKRSTSKLEDNLDGDSSTTVRFYTVIAHSKSRIT